MYGTIKHQKPERKKYLPLFSKKIMPEFVTEMYRPYLLNYYLIFINSIKKGER